MKQVCQKCGVKARYNYKGKTIGIRCSKCKKPGMINIKSPKCIVCKIVQPTYNYKDKIKATHCSKCKEPGMVDIKHLKCIECKKVQPTYNYKDKIKATHCSKCKKPGMINIKSPKCIECKIVQPTYNYKDKIKATHCSKCKKPGMIDIKSPKCIVCKKVYPIYNYKGKIKATHCNKCKEPGMIDIKSPKCIVCKKVQPVYNYKDKTKATHCNKCKEPSMIDIKSLKCIVCKIVCSHYNYKGKTKATHCSKCKEPGMIDIKSLKCIVCKIVCPIYNYKGKTKATHCSKCKESGMIDIKHPKCIVCDTIRPNYNHKSETKATHCNKCKEPGMIDVKSPKCIICNKIASYGIPHNTLLYCTQHKKEGMIYKPRARCYKKDCNEIAIYGIKRPIHCELHKKEEDLNLVEQKCVNCGKLDIVDSKGICINFCHANEEFYSIYRKRVKQKEERVVTILQKEFGKATSLDRIVQSECSKARPDIIYEKDTHIVIICCDENQHKHGYCKQGEYSRMINIVNSYGGIPVIFIRYNPDNFKVNSRQQKVSQKNKEDTLKRWVKYSLETIPSKLSQVIYLFYDDYDKARKDYYEIDTMSSVKYDCPKCNAEFYIKERYEDHSTIHIL